MSALYELMFRTEPLFNNVLLDWLLPAAIVFFLYDFAFGIVSGLYRAGVIRGRGIGSVIHWGIRYGIMFLVINTLIFIRDNWIMILLVILLWIALAFVVRHTFFHQNGEGII